MPTQNTNSLLQSADTDLLEVADVVGKIYNGSTYINVDNNHDTISLKPEAITKLESSDTVTVEETSTPNGNRVYKMNVAVSGDDLQTKLYDGDNIHIKDSDNTVNVVGKRKLVVDSPLTKTVIDDEIHLGSTFDPALYTYYAGKNLVLNDNTFDCSGTQFDYGYNNTIPTARNNLYIIGNENTAVYDSSAVTQRPSIIYGNNNSLDGAGWNVIIGQNNNAVNDTYNDKCFIFGRNNSASSVSGFSTYGAYCIGASLSAQDNHLLVGFGNKEYIDIVHDDGIHIKTTNQNTNTFTVRAGNDDVKLEVTKDNVNLYAPNNISIHGGNKIEFYENNTQLERLQAVDYSTTTQLDNNNACTFTFSSPKKAIFGNVRIYVNASAQTTFTYKLYNNGTVFDATVLEMPAGQIRYIIPFTNRTIDRIDIIGDGNLIAATQGGDVIAHVWGITGDL